MAKDWNEFEKWLQFIEGRYDKLLVDCAILITGIKKIVKSKSSESEKISEIYLMVNAFPEKQLNGTKIHNSSDSVALSVNASSKNCQYGWTDNHPYINRIVMSRRKSFPLIERMIRSRSSKLNGLNVETGNEIPVEHQNPGLKIEAESCVENVIKDPAQIIPLLKLAPSKSSKFVKKKRTKKTRCQVRRLKVVQKPQTKDQSEVSQELSSNNISYCSDLKDASNAYSFQCYRCKKCCLGRFECKMHLSSMCSEIFICRVCKEIFCVKSDLTQHLEYHTGERSVACPWPQCQRTFSMENNFIKHIRSHKDKKIETPYICFFPNCGKKYTTKNHLRRHKFVHKGQKPHICNHLNCSKRFKTRCELKSHSQVHLNDPLFTCRYPNCGKRFKDKSQIRSHSFVHMDLKRRKNKSK